MDGDDIRGVQFVGCYKNTVVVLDNEEKAGGVDDLTGGAEDGGDIRGVQLTECSRVVYYESINRVLNTRPINECRCDERLKTKVEESTHLTHTRLIGELEHLKTKTRLIDEIFASVMGEYVFLK